ncbi:MAG TPA: DUF4623 domain-containing protein [Verrucomicrobiota bacterium]|mgnify:CR=1 FL=1|nr:DUF4623 domain-containing protein [Verrucomicrobiota bacterium]
MKIPVALPALALGLLAASSATAIDVTLSPLTSFRGDGWFAPGEDGYGFLGTGNNERGIAYGNGHLYLVSRAGGVNVRILDPLTGAEVGSLNTTGIAGGTFAANMVGVGGDGAIYVGNLSTAADSSFKVYRWADEAAAPTVAYDNLSGLPRTGDSFAVIGSGAGTRIAASGSGSNGFVLVDPTAGTSTAVSPIAGTAAGDFRLGLTFVDADTVIGTQGVTFRVADMDGTLVGSPATTSASERLIGYNIVAGLPLLATVDTAGSLVRLYDATDPVNLVFLASGNTTSGPLVANGNGVGAVAWGPTTGDTATLYAMSANQGIQAFTVTVPEPGALSLLALGGAALLLRRRK